MNDENNFNIENKFINYGLNNKKEKKKSKKVIIIIIFLLLLLGIAGYLFYINKIEKESNKKSKDNYEEYDPNFEIEESNSNVASNIESNVTSNVTSDITSNITSNLNITSNVITSNSNKTSNTPSKVAVSSISFSSSTTGINVGGSKKLSVIIKPTNATNKGVTWSSSNTSVVSVDQNGKITGKKVGSATITATAKDGGKKAICKVTVTANIVVVQSIKLNVSTLNMGKGGVAILSATITPNNATNQAVTWSSSNSNIVSVDQNGNIKGVGVGTATITAKTKDGNKTASAQITVIGPAVSSISISSSKSTIYVGEWLNNSIVYYPTDASGKSVTWKSNYTGIATINSVGTVHGIAEGDVKITATTPNGKVAQKNIYVRENPANFEIVWSPLYSSCNSYGCYPTAYQPRVYKNGSQYSFNSIYYNGKTYYSYSTPSPSEINKSITTARVTTPKGNYLYSVKVTYK